MPNIYCGLYCSAAELCRKLFLCVATSQPRNVLTFFVNVTLVLALGRAEEGITTASVEAHE
jgi:hypothetical protein